VNQTANGPDLEQPDVTLCERLVAGRNRLRRQQDEREYRTSEPFHR
jgi:hypothetical protein